MPDYDLGKAHGEVEIDYDDSGVEQAKKGLDSLGDKSDAASRRVKDFSDVTQAEYDQIAKAASNLQSEVDRTAAADIAAKAKQEAAQRNLDNVRASSVSTDKAKASAEKILASAQKDATAVSEKLRISTESLASVRDRLSNSRVVVDVDVDEDKLKRIIEHLKNIDKSSKDGLTGLNTFTGRLGALAQVAAATAPSILSIAETLSQLSGLAGVAAGALAALGAAGATVKVGLSGVDAVFKDIAKDGKVSAETLGKLAPSAQEFAKSLERINPAWQSVQKNVQNRLFENLGAQVALVAQTYLPLLNTEMGNLAGQLNSGAQSIVGFVTNSTTVGEVGTIFQNTSASVRSLVMGLIAAAGALLDVASVGSGFLPSIAQGFENAAESAATFIATARQSGQLHDWIQSSLDVLRQLWDLLVNLGSILGSVFSAFSAAGGGAFESLIRLTGALAAFLKTAEGQDALNALATAMQAIGGAYGQVFLALLQALVPIVTALGPLIVQFANIVGSELVAALSALAPVIDFVSKVLTALGPVIVPFVATIYAMSKAVQAASLVWKLFSAVLATNPFILIAAAVIAIAILIFTHWDQISSFLTGVWNGIVSIATSIWNGIVDFFKGLISNIVGFFKEWGTLILAVLLPFIGIPLLIIQHWDQIVGFFKGIGSKIAGAFTSVVEWFSSLPGKIGGFLATLPGIIGNALLTALKFGLNAVIQGIEWIIAEIIAFPFQVAFIMNRLRDIIWNAIVGAWNSVTTALGDAISATVAWFVALPGRIIAALARLTIDLYIWATTSWEQAKTAFSNAVDATIAWFVALPGRFVAAVSSFASMIWQWAVDSWNGAKNATVNTINNIIDFVKGLPLKIVVALGALLGWLGETARNAWNNFLNACKSVGNDVLNYVKGIPGRLLDGLGNIGHVLLDAGKALINGFLDGIKAVISSVYDFVSGIASKVASLKGPISYDRKLLIPHGNAIMEGLHSGLKEGLNPVLDTVSTMADQISTAFSSALDIASANLEATVSTTVLPIGQAAGDLAEYQQQLAATYVPGGPGAASPTSVAAGASPATSVTIGTLTLQVAGNLDPTNKIAWREAIKSLQDELISLGKQY